MKKIIPFLVCMLVALVGCEKKEPSPYKVETGDVSNITQNTATINGVLQIDITDYSTVDFGVMYATSMDDINNYTAAMQYAGMLYGTDFSVDLTGLTEDTKYYYCAFLLLNNMQYELGEIKEFFTLEDEKTPDVPIVPEKETFVAKPFSVSATKTVTFSSGNLQYHALNSTWRFAPKQTDWIGDNNVYIGPTYDGWIDLFGWGTGDEPTKLSTDYADYETFVDWGVNNICNDAPNTWRTLTRDEWNYVLNERTNASILLGVAMVDGVTGLILLPDSWQSPQGITFKPGFHELYGMDKYGEHQTFSASDWEKLEKTGAVFLPTTGRRYDGPSIGGLRYDGYYWSASAFVSDKEYDMAYQKAHLITFYSNQTEIFPDYRTHGYAVRLVKDVK